MLSFHGILSTALTATAQKAQKFQIISLSLEILPYYCSQVFLRRWDMQHTGLGQFVLCKVFCEALLQV